MATAGRGKFKLDGTSQLGHLPSRFAGNCGFIGRLVDFASSRAVSVMPPPNERARVCLKLGWCVRTT